MLLSTLHFWRFTKRVGAATASAARLGELVETFCLENGKLKREAATRLGTS
jgi:hypothetical protein